VAEVVAEGFLEHADRAAIDLADAFSAVFVMDRDLVERRLAPTFVQVETTDKDFLFQTWKPRHMFREEWGQLSFRDALIGRDSVEGLEVVGRGAAL
jgi:hypothetical protein